MPLLIFMILFMTTPVWASDGVLLNVNQTHTLAWNWEQTAGPVESFVFRCGQYVKEIVDADARSLRFGSLADESGHYSGCTLAAKNEAGLSVPVAIPDFDYAYSYKALVVILLEWCGLIGASAGALAGSARVALGWQRRKRERAVPLALPEPLIILEKEREHVYRHY